MPLRRVEPQQPPPPPTLYDVSRLSGVSSATVSRVFSGRARVSSEVRRRVIDVARQLSYEPSHSARALAGCGTKTLGTVLPEIASGFYADVLAGVDEVAAELGFEVMAAFVGQHRHQPDLLRRLLRRGRVEAVVLLNLDGEADADAPNLANLPIILVDRPVLGIDLPVISTDNAGGAGAVIAHFFEQGHRQIGIVTGPPGNHDSDERLRGAMNAMKQFGLPFDERRLFTGDFSLEAGGRAARRYLADAAASPNLALPDAVFCLNDRMALGMLDEFRRSGMHVPGDVALAGYDDIEAAAHVSLTSVASPMRLVGQIAARWAIGLATTGERPVSHRLPVRLVVRDSSLSAAGARR